ncbi:MAG: SWIM zinc finger family protein [Thermomicrobiales bacterium]
MGRTITAGKATTAERVEAARQRAIREGIEVRQVRATDLWVASSGSNPTAAYVIKIVDGQVASCTCKAAEFGSYCKHRAAWELMDEGQVLP